jgi:hypothetical protein
MHIIRRNADEGAVVRRSIRITFAPSAKQNLTKTAVYRGVLYAGYEQNMTFYLYYISWKPPFHVVYDVAIKHVISFSISLFEVTNTEIPSTRILRSQDHVVSGR